LLAFCLLPSSFCLYNMLDINISLIIGQVVTFLVGMAILWRIAFKPLAGIFKQRADKIGGDLAAAEKARGEVERLKSDYETQLAHMAEETQKTMNRAVKDAQAVRDEIVTAAKTQGKELLDQALQQIEMEKEKAVKELRRQVLDVSLIVAEKALGEAVNGELQRRLVDRVFEQMEAGK
jgi:F-type H+-transporting ATPase subunit b